MYIFKCTCWDYNFKSSFKIVSHLILFKLFKIINIFFNKDFSILIIYNENLDNSNNIFYDKLNNYNSNITLERNNNINIKNISNNNMLAAPLNIENLNVNDNSQKTLN